MAHQPLVGGNPGVLEEMLLKKLAIFQEAAEPWAV